MRSLSGIVLLWLSALTVAADEPPPAEPDVHPPGFTVITQQSNLAQIIKDNYAANPKWWLSGLHLVDLDGDGHLDLFLSAHGTAGALAALNDGHGHFRVAPGKYPTTEIHLAYDFDEDGRVDLTMTHGDGGGQWWRNRSGTGTLDFEPTGMVRGAARRQAMIDIDRDGRADWLHGEGAAIHFNLADGRGGFFDNGRPLVCGTPDRAERLCLPADIDGDGQTDLLTEWGHYGTPEGRSRIYRNSGHGDFDDVTAAMGLPEQRLSIKGVGDLDRDGTSDLICIENKRLEIYRNDGRGKFTKHAGALVGGERGISAPSWGLAVVTDFDNDGWPDILVNGRHFLKLYRSTGDGRFLYMNDAWGIKDLSAAAVDDGLCFGDINSDGKLDIVGYTSLDNPRRVAVYRNDLPAQNWINIRLVGQAGNRGAAGAKIRLYAPGTQRLLWYEQVAIYDSQASASYYSFAQTERHFGLEAPLGTAVETVVKQLNAQLAKPREPKPQPWRESHWSNYLNYAYEFYKPGEYQRRRKLDREDSPSVKPLYLRDERFVREFGKAFLIARFARFAAAVHTGPVGGIHQEWQRPYGFGGGGLCAFWTPDAGPVILARRRGVQGAVYDRFDEWRLWPVHAVSGLTASRDLITSTRIQQPEVDSRCGATEAEVRVSGVLPKYVAAQQQTVPTSLRYERRFVLSADGVRIETSVEAAGDDQPAELYETIPVFLRETAQQPATTIRFQIGSEWRDATPEPQANVSGVQMERAKAPVRISFTRPVTARLSPDVWHDGFQTRAECRTVLVDLLSTGKPAGKNFSVAYIISPEEPAGIP